jgi:hypothetical protein
MMASVLEDPVYFPMSEVAVKNSNSLVEGHRKGSILRFAKHTCRTPRNTKAGSFPRCEDQLKYMIQSTKIGGAISTTAGIYQKKLPVIVCIR